MGETKGFKGKAAIVKGVTWGTPVLASTLHQIETTEDGMGADVELIEDDGLSGSVMQRAGDKGNELYPGSINAKAKYDSLDLLWALAFGTAGVPVQEGTEIAYKHTFRVKDDLAGLFATHVVDYQTEVHEYPSFKVDGFKLECSQSQKAAKVTFPGFADALNRNTGTGTNKTSTIAAITMAVSRAKLLFANMTLRLNAQAGAAMGAGDKQHIIGVTLELMRGIKGDEVTTERGRLIAEPAQDSWTTAKIGISFSRFATNNIERFTDQLSKAPMKADLVFAGPAIGITAYNLSFFLNDIQFESGRPNIGGSGLTPWTVTGIAHQVAASPTGFTAGFTDAVQATLISSRVTDPLA